MLSCTGHSEAASLSSVKREYKVVQERGGSKRFSQLYNDALQRHARAKQAESWLPGEYTFKPQLSARGVPDEHLVPSEHSSISACHR